MHPILTIAEQAVRAAGGEMMARAPQAPAPRSISATSEEYFQRTQARALRSIARTIERSYPDHEIVSFDAFNPTPKAEVTWVIEPINGRLNYMRRLDQFCTLVAILRGKRFEHGLIVDHFRDGQFQVTYNEGCFNNDGRMRISDTRTINNAIVALDEQTATHNLQTISSAIRVSGCFGLDLANTATGRYDAFLFNEASAFHFQFARLFIREAGGFTSTLTGGEWSAPKDGLVAGSTYFHRKLVAEYVRSNQAELVNAIG